VRSGVEDYYLGGPEAPGAWIGAGTRPLGLVGKVDAGRLDRVLAGEHPASGEPLGRVVRQRVPGFDLTFSAPKSVSVLFGVGDDALRGVIRDAHDQAVGEALGYLEREAVATRRGAGGMNVIAGRGLIGAAFRHRTSRAGDPQLHTHVLVANLVLGADGRWGTLDGRRIYAHAKTAGYLYEARLRSLLARELGLAWGPVRNGIADVDGVPASVLRAFSRRRVEIDAELARRGTTSARAAQVAALATRRAKDYRVTPERLVPEWRRRAAELGLDADKLRSLVGLEHPTPLTAERADAIADRLAGASGLTERRSSFTPRDVVQAYCELVPASAGLSVAEMEKLASGFLRSQRAVVLATGESRSTDPGAVEPERQYSTPQLLALEREIIDHAISAREHRLSPRAAAAVERAIRRRPTMAGEQAAMVRRLLLDPSTVAVVVGQAGTGKTSALAAAREAWEASGRRVIGVALARRAALELERSAGISSTSMTALLEELRRRQLSTIRRGSVVVVDEAGMVPTRELAELVRHVRDADAKLVLVGDHRQLPELGAGGAFRGLLTRVPVIELRENRRQVAQWEREALRLVRSGAATEAVDRYAARERIVVGDDAAEVRRRLVGGGRSRRRADARPPARGRRGSQLSRAHADARGGCAW
jgi:conjugative relaxase-like TrwC/TraI family protein